MDEHIQRQAKREKRHRNREIAIAFVLMLCVALGTWGQTEYFGTDSWNFLVLLNLNAILMLVVCYLAVRNIIKLVAERRRKVFGSRLRTRILLSFVSLSLIPVVLMFLAANRVIITSVDYWFTSTVAHSMDAALTVGQNIFTTASNRLTERASYINKEITGLLLPLESEKAKQDSKDVPLDDLGKVENYLEEIAKILNGNAFALVEGGEAFSRLTFTEPSSSDVIYLIQDIFDQTKWQDIDKLTYAGLFSSPTSDYAVAITKLDALKSCYLIVAENVGSTANANIQSISQGFEEYASLKSLRRPLRLSFSLILGLLGLIMIFSAIFMAVRLSKELTAPIEALSKGTDKIAQGELDIYLEDRGKDELGNLVDSFNAMIAQVRLSNDTIQQANTVLEQRNIFIESILDNISAGVFVLDLKGKVLTINKAGAALFNINAKVWEERIISDYLEGEKALVLQAMLNFLQEKPHKVWRKEAEINITNKTIKIFITALTVPDASKSPESYSQNPLDRGSEQTQKEEDSANNLVIAVVEDITELSRIERLGAWREVARRIAHEMKNPLTPIRLSAERIERKFNPEPKEEVLSDCTQLIIKEVERMQKMIKNFTEFSQIPEVKLKKENLIALLEESFQIFKASHSHIEWKLELPNENLPELLIDKDTFKQALINIYLNACEVLEEIENPKITTSVRTKEQSCIITIADNGIGLSEDSLNHMFEPYYSKKKDGTGLGLAIVQSIFTDHNASIYAKNNKLGGTSIVITMPLPKE